MKNRGYKRHLGNYAVALEKMKAKGQKFATPKEGMINRMVKGVNSDPCNRWAWFNACFLEIGGNIFATRDKYNPLSIQDKQGNFLYAQRAVDTMRNGEFYLTDDFLLGNEPARAVLLRVAEQDRKKPVGKRRVLELGKAKTHDVPTDSFADDETIVFLAEGYKRAGKYGLFVRNSFWEIQFHLQQFICKI